MLASITPLGERARGNSWPRAATAYTLGSVAGGAAMGLAMGAVGAALAALSPHPAGRLAAAVAGVLAVVAAAVDLAGHPPSIRRQVDENWLTAYRDWVYGAGFGVQLGLGAVTIVTSASIYLTWVLELLAGSVTGGVTGGLAIGATFGLVRALPLLTFAGARGADGLRRAHRRLDGALPAVARLTVAGQVLAAAALLGVAIGGFTT